MAYLKLLGQDVLHGAHVCFDQIPSAHCVSRAVDTEHRKRLADARKIRPGSNFGAEAPARQIGLEYEFRLCLRDIRAFKQCFGEIINV